MRPLPYMSFAATLQMPQLVSRYRQHYPHVFLDLRYIRTQGQKLALASNDIDVGPMIGPFDHPDFDTLTIADEPLQSCRAARPSLEPQAQDRPAHAGRT